MAEGVSRASSTAVGHSAAPVAPDDANAEPEMLTLSRLRLRFEHKLTRAVVGAFEREYREQRALRYLKSLRVTTTAFFLVNLLLIGYDLMRFQDSNQSNLLLALLLRLVILLPLCVFIVLFTYSKHYVRHTQWLAFPVLLLGWVLVAYNIVGRQPGYGTLALLIVYTHSFTPIDSLTCAVLAAVHITTYGLALGLEHSWAAGYVESSSSRGVQIFNLIGMLFMFALLVGFVGWTVEYSLRSAFLDEKRLKMERDRLFKERKLSEALLYSMLPRSVVDQLQAGRTMIADSLPEATVLFCELKLDTAAYPADKVVTVLNLVYSAFDALVDVHGVYKVETVGEVYLCVGGAPTQSPGHACFAAAMAVGMMSVLPLVRAAVEMETGIRGDQLNLRIGLNSGPVAAGIVGIKNPRYKLIGDTVNTASRMESTCLPGRIQISASCRDALLRANGSAATTHARLRAGTMSRSSSATDSASGAATATDEVDAEDPYVIVQIADRYRIIPRGVIAVKGKGSMFTYWLEPVRGWPAGVGNSVTVLEAEEAASRAEMPQPVPKVPAPLPASAELAPPMRSALQSSQLPRSNSRVDGSSKRSVEFEPAAADGTPRVTFDEEGLARGVSRYSEGGSGAAGGLTAAALAAAATSSNAAAGMAALAFVDARKQDRMRRAAAAAAAAAASTAVTAASNMQRLHTAATALPSVTVGEATAGVPGFPGSRVSRASSMPESAVPTVTDAGAMAALASASGGHRRPSLLKQLTQRLGPPGGRRISWSRTEDTGHTHAVAALGPLPLPDPTLTAAVVTASSTLPPNSARRPSIEPVNTGPLHHDHHTLPHLDSVGSMQDHALEEYFDAINEEGGGVGVEAASSSSSASSTPHRPRRGRSAASMGSSSDLSYAGEVDEDDDDEDGDEDGAFGVHGRGAGAASAAGGTAVSASASANSASFLAVPAEEELDSPTYFPEVAENTPYAMRVARGRPAEGLNPVALSASLAAAAEREQERERDGANRSSDRSMEYERVSAPGTPQMRHLGFSPGSMRIDSKRSSMDEMSLQPGGSGSGSGIFGTAGKTGSRSSGTSISRHFIPALWPRSRNPSDHSALPGSILQGPAAAQASAAAGAGAGAAAAPSRGRSSLASATSRGSSRSSVASSSASASNNRLPNPAELAALAREVSDGTQYHNTDGEDLSLSPPGGSSAASSPTFALPGPGSGAAAVFGAPTTIASPSHVLLPQSPATAPAPSAAFTSPAAAAGRSMLASPLVSPPVPLPPPVAMVTADMTVAAALDQRVATASQASSFYRLSSGSSASDADADADDDGSLEVVAAALGPYLPGGRRSFARSTAPAAAPAAVSTQPSSTGLLAGLANAWVPAFLRSSQPLSRVSEASEAAEVESPNPALYARAQQQQVAPQLQAAGDGGRAQSPQPSQVVPPPVNTGNFAPYIEPIPPTPQQAPAVLLPSPSSAAAAARGLPPGRSSRSAWLGRSLSSHGDDAATGPPMMPLPSITEGEKEVSMTGFRNSVLEEQTVVHVLDGTGEDSGRTAVTALSTPTVEDAEVSSSPHSGSQRLKQQPQPLPLSLPPSEAQAQTKSPRALESPHGTRTVVVGSARQRMLPPPSQQPDLDSQLVVTPLPDDPAHSVHPTSNNNNTSVGDHDGIAGPLTVTPRSTVPAVILIRDRDDTDSQVQEPGEGRQMQHARFADAVVTPTPEQPASAGGRRMHFAATDFVGVESAPGSLVYEEADVQQQPQTAPLTRSNTVAITTTGPDGVVYVNSAGSGKHARRRAKSARRSSVRKSARRNAQRRWQHTLTLCFNRVMITGPEAYFEREYLSAAAVGWRRFVRTSVWLALFVLGLFSLQDVYKYHWSTALSDVDAAEAWARVAIVRYAILTPLLLLFLGVTYLKYYRTSWWCSQSVTSLVMLATGLGLVAISIVGTDPGYGITALYIVYCLNFSLLGIFFRTVTLFTLIVLYMVATLLFNNAAVTSNETIFSVVYLLAFFFSQIWPVMVRERSIRQNFLRNEVIRGEKRKLASLEARSNRLLENMLPPVIVSRLRQRKDNANMGAPGRGLIADSFPEVTILWTDMKGFTNYSSSRSPLEIVAFLNAMFSTFDRILDKYGIRKVEVLGDAFFVVGGCPVASEDHAERCVNAALEMQMHMQILRRFAGADISMRVGVHSGAVVAGVVGSKDPRYHLFGHTVAVANAMESNGEPGKVHISESTYARLQARQALRAQAYAAYVARQVQNAGGQPKPPATVRMQTADGSYIRAFATSSSEQYTQLAMNLMDSHHRWVRNIPAPSDSLTMCPPMSVPGDGGGVGTGAGGGGGASVGVASPMHTLAAAVEDDTGQQTTTAAHNFVLRSNSAPYHTEALTGAMGTLSQAVGNAPVASPTTRMVLESGEGAMRGQVQVWQGTTFLGWDLGINTVQGNCIYADIPTALYAAAVAGSSGNHWALRHLRQTAESNRAQAQRAQPHSTPGTVTPDTWYQAADPLGLFGPDGGFFSFEERQPGLLSSHGVGRTYFVSRADPPYLPDLGDAVAAMQQYLHLWAQDHAGGHAW